MKDVRPHGWCLTEDYQNLLDKDNDPDGKWNPGLDYYVRLVGRLGKVFKCNNTFSELICYNLFFLVRSIQGKFPYPSMDWRFNEFPNEGTHALYTTCIELMGLPVTDPSQVGSMLVDLILDANHLIRSV